MPVLVQNKVNLLDLNSLALSNLNALTLILNCVAICLVNLIIISILSDLNLIAYTHIVREALSVIVRI